MNTQPRTQSIALAAAAFLFLCSSASAQSPGYVTNSNTTGMPDYGSFISSQIDTVNLANGGLSIRIPLHSRTARGMTSSTFYRYESKFWVVDRSQLELPGQPPRALYVWRPDEQDGMWQLSSNLGGRLDWVEQQYECEPWNPSMPDVRAQILIRSNFTWTGGDGTKYQFPVRKMYKMPGSENYPCPNYEPSWVDNLKAHSNTGHLELDITNLGFGGVGSGTIKLLTQGGSQIGWVGDNFALKDTNGNLCCSSEMGFTGGLSYYDSNGQLRTIAVEMQNITLSSAFPTSGDGNQVDFLNLTWPNRQVVKKITLANGLSYEFFYNEWWNGSNPEQINPFAEVTRIKLPTGGYIKYKWISIAGRDLGPEEPLYDGTKISLDARVIAERRVSENGVNEAVWIYEYDVGVDTKVTDPDGNVSTHFFSDGDSPVEIQTDYFQGASSPLRRVQQQWESDSGPNSLDQPASLPPGGPDFWPKARNQRVRFVTTTLRDSDQVSQTETQFQDCFNYTIRGQNLTDCRDNPTRINEFGYGGAPGPLVRYTEFTYLHNANSNYLNAHIWDRVTEKQTYAAGGALMAWTQFTYDTTSITATSGVPQHDYAGYPSTYTIRGNQTEAKRWRDSDGAWFTTTNYYNDVGNLIQTIDPGGHSTSFSYADNFSDGQNRSSQAYASQVTYPSTGGVSHIERKQYFWWTGLTAASCGQNFPGASSCSNTLSPPQADYAKYTYDLLNRPLTVTQGDGGQTTFAFNEGSLPITVSSTTKVDATQNLVSTAVIDGLGRVKQTQLNSDPQGTVYTDTIFDALGRKKTVTNPYRSTGDPTYGITTFEYDALGRVTKVIPPDGTSGSNNVTTAYSGNQTTVTDQTGKQRRSTTDALGRLVQVEEPNPTLATPAVTTYQYSALDNLTSVVQSGSRPRTFDYNSLSQLTSANNPESGTIAYTYDADGNLATKTDARSITTTYAYDALHRLSGKTYSNGDPAAAFVYDVSSTDGLSIQYSVGRLVKAAQGSTATVNSYDIAGRVPKQWQCAPSNCGSGWWALNYGYNYVGGVTTFTNGVGTTFTQSFNSAGQAGLLTSSWNDGDHPSPLVSGATYNAAGALAAMTYGNGLAETRTYNNRLQPTEMRSYNPSTQVDTLKLTYGFTDENDKNNGNVMAWAATGAQVFDRTYEYDELNRLARMDARFEPCKGYTWSYDIWGNRLNQTGIEGPCGNHNPTILANNQIDELDYDAAGNVSADGSTTYQYDAENRMKSINGGGGNNPEYTYDANGRRIRKKVSGTTTEYVYDLAGSVVVELPNAANQLPFGWVDQAVDAGDLDTTLAQGANLLVSGWACDPETGAPVSRVEVRIDGVMVGAATLGQQRPDVAAVYPSCLSSGWTMTVGIGQLATGGHTVTALAVDAAGGAAVIGGAPGITVTANSGSGNPPTGYTDVAVDAGDNDATLVQGATLFVAGWACDAETGAPVSRVEVRIDGVRIANATLGGERPDVAAVLGSQCLASGWSFSGSIGILATGMHTVSVVAVDPSNNAIELGGAKTIEVVPAPTPGWKGYVYFAGQLLAQYSDGTTYFAHKDHLGSTRVLTCVDKSVHESLDYLPYGEQIAGGSATSHKFTGQERDAESGLDYFGARFYAFAYGRFLTPDPMMASARATSPQTWNRYTYVRNNPLRLIDQDGLEESEVCRVEDSCTVTVRINVIYDKNANDGEGLTDEQKKRFEESLLASAVKEYGDSSIRLEVTYTGGRVTEEDVSGTATDAINVVVTDNGKVGVSGRLSDGSFFTRININRANSDTLGHELSHHFLGDTSGGLASTAIRTANRIDSSVFGPAVNMLLNAIADTRNDALRLFRQRYNPGTGGLMPIKDFHEGAKRFMAPPIPEANKPR